MNQKQLIQKRMQAKSLLDIRMSGSRNAVHIGANESKEHAVRKAAACHALKQMGKEFYTEAVFRSGGRADIFVLDDCLAIEVVESEELASIEKKRLSYPCRIVAITTTQEFKRELME